MYFLEPYHTTDQWFSKCSPGMRPFKGSISEKLFHKNTETLLPFSCSLSQECTVPFSRGCTARGPIADRRGSTDEAPTVFKPDGRFELNYFFSVHETMLMCNGCYFKMN